MRSLCAGTLILCACTKAAPDAAGPVAPLVASADDDIVATVDGRPIYAAAVAVQARARGVDARRALSDLVDAEVLAGAAARRGLDRDLSARLAARGAMVRRLLHDTFEHDVTPADVPADLVRKAYLRNQPYLNHDEYIDVWHILVAVPKPKQATVAEQKAARALATELATRARGQSLAEFKQLAAETRRAGHEVSDAQEVVTERDGWTQKSFSHAAFDQLRKERDTCVAETSYGAHAVYMVRFIPAVHTPLANVEAELRRGLFVTDVQKRAFTHFADEAMARHRVAMHPERLPKDGL
jgi:hypothetical protein